MEVGNYIAVGAMPHEKTHVKIHIFPDFFFNHTAHVLGTFSPGIEIWNLDVLDPLEPSATLGGMDEGGYKKNKNGKKIKRKPRLKPESHTDSVMSLSWNKVYRQALAR